MKIVDLFAGGGGASLGLHRAGFEHVAALELDVAAYKTLRAAAPWSNPVWGDVRWWWPEPADLWWASPPCQGFSNAGKGLGPLDPRNGWPWLISQLDIAIANERAPTWLVAENVPGMLAHGKTHGTPMCRGCYTDKLLFDFGQRFAWVGMWRINAADLGVPQTRNRVFIVCGPHELPPPPLTHGKGRLPWVTMREALGIEDYEPPNPGPRIIGTDPNRDDDAYREDVYLDSHLPQSQRADHPDAPARAIGTAHSTHKVRVIGAGGNPHGKGRAHERDFRDITDEPSPTVAAEQIGNRGPWVEGDSKGRGGRGPLVRSADEPSGTVSSRPGHWRTRSSPPDEPSRTIGTMRNASILDRPAPSVSATEVKGSNIKPGGVPTYRGGPPRASDALQLGTGRRRLTEVECAVLQGFPADWPFQGTSEEKYRQIGNAVPPPVAEAIGRQVLHALSGGVLHDLEGLETLSV